MLMVVPAVIVVGLVSRFALPGVAGDGTGGALYTVLAYVVIAALAPQWPPLTVALAAFGFSSALELLQLTDVPATLSDAVPPARLVFGTAFAWADLPAYAVGAGVAFVVDRAIEPPRGQPPTISRRPGG